MLYVLIRLASSRQFKLVHSTYNYCKYQKDFFKLSPFVSLPGVMINSQWLELPMSQINFYGPEDV